MSSNANNTTSGDNSSDSASNKNNNTKSQLEIVEQKLKKCSNEIESLKKRYEREWSQQMSHNHLDSFYDDVKSKNNSLSNKFQQDSPMNTKKRIDQLTHKLHTYEKRKQQLLYEQAKENQEESSTAAAAAAAQLNDANNPVNDSSTSIIATSLNTSNSNSNLNGATSNMFQPLTATSSLPFHKSSTTTGNNLSNRNASFTTNNINKIFTNDNENQIKSSIITNGDDKAIFYLNQDPVNNNYNSNNSNNNNNNNVENYVSDEQLSANEVILANYKTIQNLISMQGQQIYILKMQHEKIQTDLEELQKKTDENQKSVFKEIQDGFMQTSRLLDRMSQGLLFNYFKTIEQKLDESKQSTSQSFQSLQYNFSRFQSDVKDIKDEVAYMKNRVEIVEEKNIKNATESNPTNYYQLFYKLLDIFLTLATIVLLAFTNLIASIKFIFLLYPRTIVILLFFYFLFVYLVDHNKLLLLFNDDSSLIDQHFDNQFSSSNFNSDFSLQSNLTYIGKLFRSIYKLILNLRRTPSSSTSTTAST